MYSTANRSQPNNLYSNNVIWLHIRSTFRIVTNKEQKLYDGLIKC